MTILLLNDVSYTIGRRLGTRPGESGGSLSNVNLAHVTDAVDQQVIIKRYPANRQEAYKIEYETLAKLNVLERPTLANAVHFAERWRIAQETSTQRHIIAMLDHGMVAGQPIVVLEKAPGEVDTLPLPEKEALELAVQATATMKLTHGAGFAWADLRPDSKSDRFHWDGTTLKILDWNSTQPLTDELRKRDVLWLTAILYSFFTSELPSGKNYALPRDSQMQPTAWHTLTVGTQQIFEQALSPNSALHYRSVQPLHTAFTQQLNILNWVEAENWHELVAGFDNSSKKDNTALLRSYADAITRVSTAPDYRRERARLKLADLEQAPSAEVQGIERQIDEALGVLRYSPRTAQRQLAKLKQDTPPETYPDLYRRLSYLVLQSEILETWHHQHGGSEKERESLRIVIETLAADKPLDEEFERQLTTLRSVADQGDKLKNLFSDIEAHKTRRRIYQRLPSHLIEQVTIRDWEQAQQKKLPELEKLQAQLEQAQQNATYQVPFGDQIWSINELVTKFKVVEEFDAIERVIREGQYRQGDTQINRLLAPDKEEAKSIPKLFRERLSQLREFSEVLHTAQKRIESSKEDGVALKQIDQLRERVGQLQQHDTLDQWSMLPSTLQTVDQQLQLKRAEIERSLRIRHEEQVLHAIEQLSAQRDKLDEAEQRLDEAEQRLQELPVELATQALTERRAALREQLRAAQERTKKRRTLLDALAGFKRSIEPRRVPKAHADLGWKAWLTEERERLRDLADFHTDLAKVEKDSGLVEPEVTDYLSEIRDEIDNQQSNRRQAEEILQKVADEDYAGASRQCEHALHTPPLDKAVEWWLQRFEQPLAVFKQSERIGDADSDSAIDLNEQLYQLSNDLFLKRVPELLTAHSHAKESVAIQLLTIAGSEIKALTKQLAGTEGEFEAENFDVVAELFAQREHWSEEHKAQADTLLDKVKEDKKLAEIISDLARRNGEWPAAELPNWEEAEENAIKEFRKRVDALWEQIDIANSDVELGESWDEIANQHKKGLACVRNTRIAIEKNAQELPSYPDKIPDSLSASIRYKNLKEIWGVLETVKGVTYPSESENYFKGQEQLLNVLVEAKTSFPSLVETIRQEEKRISDFIALRDIELKWREARGSRKFQIVTELRGRLRELDPKSFFRSNSDTGATDLFAVDGKLTHGGGNLKQSDIGATTLFAVDAELTKRGMEILIDVQKYNDARVYSLGQDKIYSENWDEVAKKEINNLRWDATFRLFVQIWRSSHLYTKEKEEKLTTYLKPLTSHPRTEAQKHYWRPLSRQITSARRWQARKEKVGDSSSLKAERRIVKQVIESYRQNEVIVPDDVQAFLDCVLVASELQVVVECSLPKLPWPLLREIQLYQVWQAVEERLKTVKGEPVVAQIAIYAEIAGEGVKSWVEKQEGWLQLRDALLEKIVDAEREWKRLQQAKVDDDGVVEASDDQDGGEADGESGVVDAGTIAKTPFEEADSGTSADLAADEEPTEPQHTVDARRDDVDDDDSEEMLVAPSKVSGADPDNSDARVVDEMAGGQDEDTGNLTSRSVDDDLPSDDVSVEMALIEPDSDADDTTNRAKETIPEDVATSGGDNRASVKAVEAGGKVTLEAVEACIKQFKSDRNFEGARLFLLVQKRHGDWTEDEVEKLTELQDQIRTWHLFDQAMEYTLLQLLEENFTTEHILGRWGHYLQANPVSEESSQSLIEKFLALYEAIVTVADEVIGVSEGERIVYSIARDKFRQFEENYFELQEHMDEVLEQMPTENRIKSRSVGDPRQILLEGYQMYRDLCLLDWVHVHLRDFGILADDMISKLIFEQKRFEINFGEKLQTLLAKSDWNNVLDTFVKAMKEDKDDPLFVDFIWQRVFLKSRDSAPEKDRSEILEMLSRKLADEYGTIHKSEQEGYFNELIGHTYVLLEKQKPSISEFIRSLGQRRDDKHIQFETYINSAKAQYASE